MKIKMTLLLLVMTTTLALPLQAFAHFGMVIPSDSMVMQGENRTVTLTYSFSHPFEGIGMALVEPNKCAVVSNGETSDLTANLKETRVMGQRAWKTEFPIKRPGVYVFYMEPKPFWEPLEDCFIIHYTKTVVAAFGEEEGWDTPLGLKTEIIPLTRPFGLYAGNVFQGIVLRDGKPVPFAEVEIEFYNREGKAKAPTDLMVTQVTKADANGTFTYAVPKAGWWGFAALSTSDQKIKHEGKEKDVELGAVLWVEFQEWEERVK
jgi:cobalt/nickel transport protein